MQGAGIYQPRNKLAKKKKGFNASLIYFEQSALPIFWWSNDNINVDSIMSTYINPSYFLYTNKAEMNPVMFWKEVCTLDIIKDWIFEHYEKVNVLMILPCTPTPRQIAKEQDVALIQTKKNVQIGWRMQPETCLAVFLFFFRRDILVYQYVNVSY